MVNGGHARYWPGREGSEEDNSPSYPIRKIEGLDPNAALTRGVGAPKSTNFK